MTWTFPLPRVPAQTPTVPELRRLTVHTLRTLAERTRGGACPVASAPAPRALATGWPHWHPWPELFVQLAGGSRFATPDGEVRVETQHCLVIPPLLAHREHVARPRGGFANLVFGLSGRQLIYHLTVAVADGDRRRLHVLQPDMIEPANPQLGLAALIGLSTAADEDARAGWLLAFCAWTASAIETAPPPGFTGSERIRRTHGLILARLGSATLSVVQLGAWVGCHPDHLGRLFRHETGETIVGHIRRQRLERARELLADENLRVADVARLVGMPDPAYFSRVFRRTYGVPPGTARQTSLVG